MKVRLKRGLVESPALDGWLAENVDYHVLSIKRWLGRERYRIASEKDGMPVLFDADKFDIVDDTIPENWVATETEAGPEWAPAPWNEPEFWERAFNDDPQALAVYKQEKKKITG
jgi:hypothetical protein